MAMWASATYIWDQYISGLRVQGMLTFYMLGVGVGTGLRACKKKYNKTEASPKHSTAWHCMLPPEQAVA